MFYVPKLIWKEYCANKVGAELENIINSSIAVGKCPVTERNMAHKEIASLIEALLHFHRDNRHGFITDVKRLISQKSPWLICGKRSGNSILGTYMLIKLLYIANAIGQWFLMIKSLQITGSVTHIFIDVYNYIVNGYDWEASKHFPRVTFCKLNFRSLGAMDNQYVAQCVLPIKIFNEKIYILLFIWMVILITVMIIYLPSIYMTL